MVPITSIWSMQLLQLCSSNPISHLLLKEPFHYKLKNPTYSFLHVKYTNSLSLLICLPLNQLLLFHLSSYVCLSYSTSKYNSILISSMKEAFPVYFNTPWVLLEQLDYTNSWSHHHIRIQCYFTCDHLFFYPVDLTRRKSITCSPRQIWISSLSLPTCITFGNHLISRNWILSFSAFIIKIMLLIR